MSCECGAARDGDCFQISHFAHQNNVGVLTQEGAQAGSESKSNVFVNLNLCNLLEAIFNGVFQRDDVYAFTVDTVQGRLECRRLSASGGPRDKVEPLRMVNHFLVKLADCSRHLEIIQVKEVDVLA